MLYRVTVGVCLAPHVYKYIAEQPVGLEDLKLVDPALYANYNKLLQQDIKEDIGLTFETESDEFGCVTQLNEL